VHVLRVIVTQLTTYSFLHLRFLIFSFSIWSRNRSVFTPILINKFRVLPCDHVISVTLTLTGNCGIHGHSRTRSSFEAGCSLWGCNELFASLQPVRTGPNMNRRRTHSFFHTSRLQFCHNQVYSQQNTEESLQVFNAVIDLSTYQKLWCVLGLSKADQIF
jgi:hypothetical protein